MKLRISAALSALLLVTACVAHAKSKKPTVAAVFQTAHTVYVESVDGDISKPGVSRADREAVQQVKAALKEWNRYKLVDTPQDAALVIVVHKGHAVGDADHLGLGPRPRPIEPPPPVGESGMQPRPGSNIQDASAAMGGDDIAEQDMLRVYTVNQKGRLKGPIWSREMDGGLDGPSARLLRQLQAAVEITYPMQTAQQPPQ